MLTIELVIWFSSFNQLTFPSSHLTSPNNQMKIILFTCAIAASSAVAGIVAVGLWRIICAATTAHTATIDTVVIDIIVVGCIVVVKSWKTAHATTGCCDRLAFPSTDNTPNAVPKSSFSFPFYVCGYLNTACYDTP